MRYDSGLVDGIVPAAVSGCAARVTHLRKLSGTLFIAHVLIEGFQVRML